MDFRTQVKEARLKNIRMYQLVGTEASGYQNALYEACMKDGALDRKTKELIGLGIGICVRCEPCMYGHIEKAVGLGATIEEIAEVCKVALIMAGGPGTAYSGKAIACAEEYIAARDAKKG